MNGPTRIVALVISLVSLSALAACSGSGQPRVSYGVGFGSYYGASPWRHYPGRPIYVGGGGGIDLPDEPIAAQMPDFGMPDMGGAADFADFDF